MSELTDHLDAVVSKVKELEDSVTGASPLQAKLDKQQADLYELATAVKGQLAELESGKKNLAEAEGAVADREDKVTKRETAVEAAKAELKALATAPADPTPETPKA